MARGVGSRGTGTNNINSNGADAFKKSRQSTKGHYRVAFTNIFEKMTERDISLKYTYGKDLLSSYLSVPVDMISLKPKRSAVTQTLTALDEVFYVKVGKEIYGKLSIRVQRLRKNNLLIFIFQDKKAALKPPKKSYSRSGSFKKKTTSQVSQTKRQSYNSRKGGKK
ncbi:hypothetical protein PBC6_120 [Bacillus phage PBC6]|nr:hypothetical protein PBC6_120 [Bacillus phage PBC6]